MTAPTQPQPPAPSMPPAPQPGRSLTWLWVTLAVVIAVPILLIGLAVGAWLVVRSTVEVGPVDVASAPADQVVLTDSGSSCVVRQNGPSNDELCIVANGEAVAIRASGLQPGSVATVTGEGGDTLNLTVDPDGSLDADVGGKIAGTDFSVSGLWADGEPAAVSVVHSE